MTTVTINPGICGFITKVTAESEDQEEVKIQVTTGCKAVKAMFEELPDTFDAFEVCLKRPGEGELYEYASKHLPGHAACPIISGVIKCMEAECRLALKADASIKFVD